MRIAPVDVPHPAIGSRIPREGLPPPGAGAGGPPFGDGHRVTPIAGGFAPCRSRTGLSRLSAGTPGFGGGCMPRLDIGGQIGERRGEPGLVIGRVDPRRHMVAGDGDFGAAGHRL